MNQPLRPNRPNRTFYALRRLTLAACLLSVVALSVGTAACGTDDPVDRRPVDANNNDPADNNDPSDNNDPADNNDPSDNNGPVVEHECESADDCTGLPATVCEGNLAVSHLAGCVGDDDGVRRCVLIEEDEVCAHGCEAGACNADPCAGVSCNTPPEAACLADGTTLVSFAPAGVCEADAGCSYERNEQSCAFGCADGACNAGVCDTVTCDTPPDDRCEGNTAIKYNDRGACRDSDGAAACNYGFSFDNCSYRQATCVDGACEGGITQSGEVVIVEVMASVRGFAGGQWFEVVNTTGAPVDMSGWTIRSGPVAAGDADEAHTIAAGTQIAAGGRFLFSAASDPTGEGTVEPDYRYGRTEVILNTSTDWLALVKPGGDIVDFVFWEPGAMLEGRSRKLDPALAASAEGNDDFSAWCPSMGDAYGPNPRNHGTPGAENTPCIADPCAGFSCTRPEPFCNRDGDAVQFAHETASCEVTRFNNPYCDFGATTVACAAGSEMCLAGVCEALPANLAGPNEVVITELMGDPSAVNDNVGEWIEVFNRTDRELSLYSLAITDNEEGNAFDSYLITDRNATVPPRGYAVFVRNTDPALNGGIQGGYLFSGAHLKNSAGAGMTIRLVAHDGTLITEAHYGRTRAGQSQQLDPYFYLDATYDIELGLDPDFWCPGTTSYGDGDRGTPGAENLACE